jgi:hypothetical protein
MTSKLSKDCKINKNSRIVEVPCIECGYLLEFRIENETVISGGGVIASNIPGGICQDCVDSVLSKVADPPGLICFKNLNPTLAQEIILNFEFLLPSSEMVKFFVSLFPENELVNEACAKRLHFQSSL